MRTARRVAFALPFAALALLLLLKLSAPPAPTGWRKYAVRSGDTLWGIASAYGEDYDPRDIVWEIEQKNGCGAMIRPGDVLLVPEY